MNSFTFNNISKFISPLGSLSIEQFSQSVKEPFLDEILTKKQKIINTVYFVFFIILGLFCAILSWRVNSETFFLLKILYALLAYFFAPIYIAYYILYYMYTKFINKSKSTDIYDNSLNILNNTKLTENKLPNANIPNTYISDNISVNK